MKIFNPEILKTIKRSQKIVFSPQTGQYEWAGRVGSSSGVFVDHLTAMQTTAVYGSVRILSSLLASFPLILYKRLAGGGKERATEHPLYKITHNNPNEFQDAFQFKETLQAHLALRGNAYCLIERNLSNGKVLGLFTLEPDRVFPKKVRIIETKKVRIIYEYYTDFNEKIILTSDEVLHLKGLTTSGIMGLDPIMAAKNMIGSTIATEEHASRFFSNGARLGGILKYPGKLTKEGIEKIKTSFAQKYEGVENAGKTAVLEEGMSYEPVGMTLQQAEFIEQRQFNKKDICSGIFGIPSHMLGGDVETISNVEEFSRQLIDYTLNPWLKRWELAFNNNLLTLKEQETYFFEFLTDAFLRSNASVRATKLAIERQNGIINADEWREIENKNPLPDGAGKLYLNPLNMAVAGGSNPAQVKEPQPPGKTLPAPEGVNNDPAARSRNEIAYEIIEEVKPVLIKEFERIIRRELKNLTELEKKPQFIEDFYVNHKEHVKEVLKPGIEFLSNQIEKKTGYFIDKERVLEKFSLKFTDKTRNINDSNWHFDELLRVFCYEIEENKMKERGVL